MSNKLEFFTRVIRHKIERQARVCPYCREPTALDHMARKKLVLEVYRCQKCSLIFRWPRDTQAEAYSYYQYAYSKSAPYIQLPAPAKLSELLRTNFAGSPLDRHAEIAIVKTQRASGRVLDYGCSWGFTTHQFTQQGFQATGFEISKVRAAFGRQSLGVQILEDLQALRAMPRESFDIIYSHQVLKNLSDIRSAFEVMRHLLAHNGLMFHVVPHFARMLAKNKNRLNWIGEEHPIAPTREFFEYSLPQNGFKVYRIVASPFAENLGIVERGISEKVQSEDDLLVLATRECGD